MSDMPFIKFFPGDFLGGTGGLSPTERGVYITILCLIWENDGPVDMDDARLARRCGMPKAAFLKAMTALIDEGKLSRTGSGISNERAEKTLMDRRNRIKNATHAANSRHHAQTEKNEENQRADDATAMPEQCVDDAKPEARSQSIEEDTNVSSLSSGDDLSEAVADYNAAAEASGWPQVRILSKSRRSALRARLSECGGIDGWRAALARARASPLCNGSNDRGWTANFDFMTRQSSFAKLMEGNYDQRTGASFGGTNAGGGKIAVSAGSRFSPRENPFQHPDGPERLFPASRG